MTSREISLSFGDYENLNWCGPSFLTQMLLAVRWTASQFPAIIGTGFRVCRPAPAAKSAPLFRRLSAHEELIYRRPAVRESQKSNKIKHLRWWRRGELKIRSRENPVRKRSIFKAFRCPAFLRNTVIYRLLSPGDGNFWFCRTQPLPVESFTFLRFGSIVLALEEGTD